MGRPLGLDARILGVWRKPFSMIDRELTEPDALLSGSLAASGPTPSQPRTPGTALREAITPALVAEGIKLIG